MGQSSATGDAKADTGFLEATLGFQLRCAQLAVFRDITAVFRDVPATIVQFSALTVIEENPGITQADLATAIEVERPRIVPILDAMEERQWTERRIDGSDRRMRRIHLTEEGRRVLAQLKQRFVVHQERMAQRLSAADTDRLMAALRDLSGR